MSGFQGVNCMQRIEWGAVLEEECLIVLLHCVTLWCDGVYESRGGVSYCGVTLRLGKGAGPLIYMHYRNAMLYILYQYVVRKVEYFCFQSDPVFMCLMILDNMST